MRRRSEGRARATCAFLCATVLATSPASADWSGTVRDAATGRAITGAVVRVQATGKTPATTDAQGRYTLAAAPFAARVAAAAKGYFTSGRDAPKEGTVDFVLDPVPYDPAEPVLFSEPSACAGCHREQVDDWQSSAMAHAGTNTWVEDVYMGTGTPGGSGGFVYTRDSIHAKKNPASECAACHQPESWANEPFSALRPSPDTHSSVTRGVSCLTCHLIANVDEARPNDPGIFPRTVRMSRGAVVRYGVLGDVDFFAEGRMRASYQPQLSSVVCGTCHQDANDPDGTGRFDGPVSEPTYLEWKKSPYGDPANERFTSCMGCHSTPSTTTSASNLQVTAARPAGRIRTHTFEGTTPSFLRRAATVVLETRLTGDVLEATVAVTNVGAGHHLPTGVTMRNAILLVEAQGPEGKLEHLGREIVGPLGGIGRPEEGYFAGLPGKLYAQINASRSGESPTVFTEAVELRSDNRIPALATDRAVFPFRYAGAGPVRVKARLIYRRAFRALIDAKGWQQDGHGRPLADLRAPDFGELMASAEQLVPRPGATPNPTPDAGAPPTSQAPPETTSGCSTTGSTEGPGAFATGLLVLVLAQRRRCRKAAVT